MAAGVEYYRNCPVGRYHNFKVLTEGVDGNEQVEVCRYCGVKKIYKFTREGQLVNQEQYLRDHIRFFAQPSQTIYYDIHPDAASKFLVQDKKKKKSEEFQADMSDKFKYAVKKAFDDRPDGIKKK